MYALTRLQIRYNDSTICESEINPGDAKTIASAEAAQVS
jgi:hypothetical protein